MTGAARRLVTAATALMPPSRRDWGRAIAAELDQAGSPGDRARLVLGAVRVVLLPPPGLAGYRQAGGTLAVGAVVYLGVAGAVFAPIGAALGRELAIAWSRVRGPGG